MTTTPLSPTQTADLKRLLEQRLRELEALVDARLHAGGDTAIRVSPSGEPDATAAEAEAGIERVERDLAQVNEACHALAKFAAKAPVAYGECERCGEPVGYPRLLAHPAARLCLACQVESESQSAQPGGRRADGG